MNKQYTATIGSSNFRELVSNNDLTVAPDKLFVDKTLFIKDFLDNSAKVLLITRPRRWGKSLTLSMLQHFLCPEVANQPTEGLFKNLKIEQYLSDPRYKKYQGSYPVILVSFKDLKGNNYEEIESKIRGILANLYMQYGYILKALKDRNSRFYPDEELYNVSIDKFKRIMDKKGDYDDLTDSLQFLSELLTKYHGKKTFILIDEYDNAINSNFNQPEILEKLTNFFGNLFSACLKENDDYLEKGLITGILRIAKANIFSGLNNPTEETILDYQFSEYYGFTEPEVTELLNKAGLHDKTKIKAWYNGYVIGNNTLYNPWSIMQCINKNGELKPYWVDTANPKMIEDLLINKSSVEDKQKIRDLIKHQQATLLDEELEKQVSFDDLKNRPEIIWSLLLHTGYLTLINTSNDQHQVRLPNQEVVLLVKKYINNWFITKPFLTKTANSLLAGDFATFEIALRKILNDEAYSARIFSGGGRASREPAVEQTKEFMYQFLIMTELRCINLFGEAEYEVFAEPEDISIGKTRPDLLVVNHKQKLCIVVEIKVANHKCNDLHKLANIDALEQIKRNQYGKKYQEEYGYQILPLGISFKGNEFVLAYNKL